MTAPGKKLIFIAVTLAIVGAWGTRFERTALSSEVGVAKTLVADRWTGERYIVDASYAGSSEYAVSSADPGLLDGLKAGQEPIGLFAKDRVAQKVSYAKRNLATFVWGALVAVFAYLAWRPNRLDTSRLRETPVPIIDPRKLRDLALRGRRED